MVWHALKKLYVKIILWLIVIIYVLGWGFNLIYQLSA